MTDIPHFPLSAVVGADALKLALCLTAIDPKIGGVLIEGPRGMAKSTLARGLADLLASGQFVTLPLGATEERLVGTLDLDAALGEGRAQFSPGVLAKADGGVLYVDEVNLLPDHLVDPHPERLSPGSPGYEEICMRHRAAIEAGQPMYEDPSTGLWVMTAGTLWGRPCCNNRCRHCPHEGR